MAKLIWDAAGERFFETGVSKGVLYTMNEAGTAMNGVAWNGLTAVTESPSGAEANPLYADNVKYLSLQSAEEFGATIEAYTYPDEFAACDGTAELGVAGSGVLIGQQPRKSFALCYSTVLGNDEDGEDHGRKIHIIYGAKAAPSERAYATINDSPEAITFSWEVTTSPVAVAGHKAAASLVIDTTKIDPVKLVEIEEKLYGKDATTDPVAPATLPELLTPDQIYEILSTVG